MRCPDCNKFVGFDEPEVEISSSDISSSDATVTTRVVLKCSECGNELKDSDIEAMTPIEHVCEKRGEKDENYEWEDEPTEAEPTDRYQTEDRKGKPIKNPRYQKHFYGFEASGSVKCTHCDEVIQLDFSGEEQASGFNELV